MIEYTKKPLATVQHSYGGAYLSIDGLVIAMEGDVCRDGDMPNEVYSPIPADELERSSVGGKPCKEMDPQVVRFFRGCRWNISMLEHVARRINAATQLAPPDSLAAAAEEANTTVYLVAAYLHEQGKKFYAEKLRDAADRLAAALEKRGR